VRIRPDRSGPNAISITLRDSRGRPVTQAHGTVLYTMLDMVMGTGLGPTRQVRPGIYQGELDLGMGGRWRMQILVFTPSGLTRLAVVTEVGV
jgi:hypothetical protein